MSGKQKQYPYRTREETIVLRYGYKHRVDAAGT